MRLFVNDPIKKPSGIKCDKCGKFIGQDGEIYYEKGDDYFTQDMYIIGGNCEKCIAKAEGESKVREKHSKPVKYVDVLFVENKDKPPFTMELVEVENEYGESVDFGEWVKDGEYSRLRIPLAKAEGEVE